MSDDKSMPDWLPEGWKMEVRLRKNGRKDKFYTDPSNGLKFFSKPEVLRHLGNMANDHLKFEENKGGQNHSAANFVVEKAVAEGLPPGWIKEVRIKKKGHKIIRRDPYYIDPTNNYVFRSMREVSRFLENGEPRSPATKRKEDSINVEMGVNSSVETEEKKLVETPQQVHGNQSLKQDVFNSDCIQESSKKEGGILAIKSTPGEKSIAVTTSHLSDTNESVQREDEDNSICKIGSAPEVGAPPEKQPSGSELQSNENGMSQHGSQKLKNKKGSDLPRRTSKRLAGLKVDPPLELKAKSQACQVVAATKQSSEAETIATENPIDLTNSEKHVKVIGVEKTTSVKRVKTIEIGKTSDEKQGCCVEVEKINSAKHVKIIEVEENSDEKQGCSIEVVNTNSAKRVKRIEVEKTSDEKQGRSIEGEKTNLEKRAKMIEEEKNNDEKQGCSIVFPNEKSPARGVPAALVDSNNKGNESLETPLNLSSRESWMDVDPCIEFATKVLTGAIPIEDDNKANENTGTAHMNFPGKNQDSPSDLLPGFLWADPCIEFAVKTLTGEIPVQDYFQKQFNSSKTQVQNRLALPTANLDHLHKRNSSSQDFRAAEKPPYRQEAAIIP